MLVNGSIDDSERLWTPSNPTVKMPGIHSSHAWARLDDLRVPPGNRLEALRGDRQGQHNIRANDQWRISLTWRHRDAWDVVIVDCHLPFEERTMIIKRVRSLFHSQPPARSAMPANQPYTPSPTGC